MHSQDSKDASEMQNSGLHAYHLEIEKPDEDQNRLGMAHMNVLMRKRSMIWKRANRSGLVYNCSSDILFWR